MNIVITGFMGTGKTAVGRRLAERLQINFVDTDAEIQRTTGRTLGDIFNAEGEAGFRKIESQVIAELAQRDRTVISTGGGALISPDNRKRLQDHGILVCLTARTGTLLERLKDDVTRPMLAGEDLAARMERLLKERQSIYAECPIQVATDEKTIPQVTDEIAERLRDQWDAT